MTQSQNRTENHMTKSTNDHMTHGEQEECSVIDPYSTLPEAVCQLPIKTKEEEDNKRIKDRNRKHYHD